MKTHRIRLPLWLVAVIVGVALSGCSTLYEYEVVRNPLGPLQALGDQALHSVR